MIFQIFDQPRFMISISNCFAICFTSLISSSRSTRQSLPWNVLWIQARRHFIIVNTIPIIISSIRVDLEAMKRPAQNPICTIIVILIPDTPPKHLICFSPHSKQMQLVLGWLKIIFLMCEYFCMIPLPVYSIISIGTAGLKEARNC